MLRPAFLAGQWYPGSERECRAAIESHAADARPEQGPWRGAIAPHAGWTYSGDAAAQSYRWLAAGHAGADLVVVFGAHRAPRGPNTVLLADGWETPLGPLDNAVALAREVQRRVAAALALDLQEEPVAPRNPDNAAELHMPFVRHFFPRAELLMLGVEASTRAIDIGAQVGAAVAEAKRDAVFIGSTDLTHYGPNYRFEPHGPGAHGEEWVRNVNDRGFIDAVLRDDAAAAVAHAAAQQSACCAGAAAACMAATASVVGKVAPRLLDHYLSSDVRPASSFVGYAGILL